jgi:hypothetical protein
MEQIRKQIEEAKKAVAAAKAKVAAIEKKTRSVEFINLETGIAKIIKLVPMVLLLFFCFNSHAQRYTATSLQYTESTKEPGLGFVDLKEDAVAMCFVASGSIVFNYNFQIEQCTKTTENDGTTLIYIVLENQGSIELHIDSNNFLNYAIYDAPAYNDPKIILR